MNQDDKKLILRVFSSVLEDFAFMFVEESSDLEPENPGTGLRAEIEFEGENNKGFLEIIAPLDFCRETAQNILGTDPEELPEGAGEDALKEMVNIACGCLLAEKFGTEEIFNLSIPVVVAVSTKEWKGLCKDGRHLFFEIDETPCLVRLFFQN